MPRPLINLQVEGAYFRWRLSQRGYVWYADGRTNSPPAGRHSLMSTNLEEAKATLRKLEQDLAQQLGLIKLAAEIDAPTPLGLQVGWELYRTHASRARTAGGVKTKTVNRYRRSSISSFHSRPKRMYSLGIV